MKRQLHFVAGLALTLSLTAVAQAQPGTLRVAVSTLPLQQGNPFMSSLMPTITTTGAIFDSLTKYNRAGKLEPWLAVKWDHTDDKTWRFTLRPGVTFSNGRPVTAASVAAVVDYIVNRARPNENMPRELPKLLSARAIDDFMVEIVTAQPAPLLPRYGTMLLIPDMTALDAVGMEVFSKAPVGSGAYAVESWTPAKVSLKAHTGSWRKPIIPKLEILALPETMARTQGILSGQIDVATTLGPEEYETLLAAGHQALPWSDDTVNGLALVTTRENSPFKDVRVRRALNHAVNRKPMLDAIFLGLAKPANQPAARVGFGHNPDLPPFDYDPAKAKALLAEAGYPEGFKFTMEVSGVFAFQLALYQLVQSDLRKIGVDMEIRTLPAPQFLKNVFMTGEYADAFNMPWTGVPISDILRGVEMHSCAHNVPWTCDPAVMPLIESIRNEWDERKSLRLRRQLMAYYHDQVPAIFLYDSVQFSGARKGVKGLDDLFGFIPFERVSFEE
ncbi:MAG: ABC transporter substrate-binding protein [Rhodospirillaceae bacterium]|nr:ABC transporter substrate-binding protein [Rhodospirillaceae bacterium]